MQNSLPFKTLYPNIHDATPIISNQEFPRENRINQITASCIRNSILFIFQT